MEQLTQGVCDLEEDSVLEQVRRELAGGTEATTILDACRTGMVLVGERFESNEYFVSDLVMAGEIFKQVVEILSPELVGTTVETKGKVVLGTVVGDIHDIGKDLVLAMLKAANYEVVDLGVDVPTDRFLSALDKSGAEVLALSGLLTISFDSMKEVVAALDESGMRPGVRVMIGGGPVNEMLCEHTGADGWGDNAQAAVNLCNKWLEDGTDG